MPTFISMGALNVNTPQQNGCVFLGQINITGMDANMKFNTAMGGTWGQGNVVSAMNFMNDGQELVDGMINDQDVKGEVNAQT